MLLDGDNTTLNLSKKGAEYRKIVCYTVLECWLFNTTLQSFGKHSYSMKTATMSYYDTQHTPDLMKMSLLIGVIVELGGGASVVGEAAVVAELKSSDS